MNRHAIIGWISALFLTLMPWTAAASVPVDIVINNRPMEGDAKAVLQKGAAVVPLELVGQIPGLSVSWDVPTQTAVIQGGEAPIRLVAGSNTAMVGDKPLKLPFPSKVNQGQMMVPLRFIAEASSASVTWNASTRTVYVTKSGRELREKLSSSDLTTARQAALALPRVSGLQEFPPDPDFMGDQAVTYYFPEGSHDFFFVETGDVISYYEPAEDHSERLWSARVDYRTGQNFDLLPLLPYPIVEENGERPGISGRNVFFRIMPHIAAADYGYVDSDGTRTTVGTQKLRGGDETFALPEEQP